MDKNDITRKLNEANEKRSSVYKDIADFGQKIVDEKRGYTGEEDSKREDMLKNIEPLDGQIRSFKDQIKALDEQAHNDASIAEEIRSGATATSNSLDDDQYRSAFDGFMRTGDADELREATRSLSGIVTTKGEEIVPTDFFSAVEARIAEENSLSGLIQTVSIGSRNAKFAIHTGLSVAKPREEGGEYNVNDGTLGQKTVQIYNLGHITKVSEELLDDSFTDVQAFVASDMGQAYANAIELFGLQGKEGAPLIGETVAGLDGLVPTGLLNDPDIEELETAVSGSLTLDDMYELLEDVPSSVSGRSSILTHKSVTKSLRMMKDADDRPLWQPNLEAGRPSVFGGHEIHKSDYMPAMAGGNKSILFGDFSKVTMYLRQQMTLRRLQEAYATSGQVGFRGSLRMDIVCRQPAALRTLKIK